MAFGWYDRKKLLKFYVSHMVSQSWLVCILWTFIKHKLKLSDEADLKAVQFDTSSLMFHLLIQFSQLFRRVMCWWKIQPFSTLVKRSINFHKLQEPCCIRH